MVPEPFLFQDCIVDAPSTEGIKYIGSKLKLLPQILRLARKTGADSVLDAFSGSTRVSQALAKMGYRVIANDLAVWSETFATCYLLNDSPRKTYTNLIAHLNALEPKDGWFSEHYGGCASHSGATRSAIVKKPWQLHNTRKLDAVREGIDRLSLSPIDRAVAITSLVLALDRVDSTLGHFASYLREWSPRSFKPLQLEVPNVVANENEHQVLRRDVFDVSNLDVDLAYYDPPYGSNNEKMPPSRVRYASYYHLWTTVCMNDRPTLFGKVMRRADSKDKVAASRFEEFRRNKDSGRFLAVEAIEKLIQGTKARWIILSYSSGGRATAEELDQAIRNTGTLVEVVEMDHKRNIMSEMRWTNEWIQDAQSSNREFLFLVDRG